MTRRPDDLGFWRGLVLAVAAGAVSWVAVIRILDAVLT